MSALSLNLPDTPYYRAMRDGHLNRTGHELVAYNVSDDGYFFYLKRVCCPELATTWDSLLNP